MITTKDMNHSLTLYLQEILNLELFGPVTNETVVILVQVHDRIHYLRQLIRSFSQANEIHKTLLIFRQKVKQSLPLTKAKNENKKNYAE